MSLTYKLKKYETKMKTASKRSQYNKYLAKYEHYRDRASANPVDRASANPVGRASANPVGLQSNSLAVKQTEGLALIGGNNGCKFPEVVSKPQETLLESSTTTLLFINGANTIAGSEIPTILPDVHLTIRKSKKPAQIYNNRNFVLSSQSLINNCDHEVYAKIFDKNIIDRLVDHIAYVCENIAKEGKQNIANELMLDILNIDKKSFNDPAIHPEVIDKMKNDILFFWKVAPEDVNVTGAVKNIREYVKAKFYSDFSDMIRNIDMVTELYSPPDYIYHFKYCPQLNLLMSNNTDIIKINAANNNGTDKDFATATNPYNLEHLTLTGGGAKGIIYVGTLMALMVSGSIMYLNRFTGTSAGALTSCVLACITPSKEKYENEIHNKPLNEISQIIIDKYWACVMYVFRVLYNINFGTLFGISDALAGSAVYAIFIGKSIVDTTKEFIPWFQNLCKNICIVMENGLDEYIDNENFFTFDQYNKMTGKTLVLVSTNVRTNEGVFFSHEKYQNVSVLKAVNSSMAIPLVFPSVGVIPNEEKIQYIDGGVYHNYAIDNNDIYNSSNKIDYYDRKQFGQFLEVAPTTPYEIIRALIMYRSKLFSIKDVFHKCMTHAKIGYRAQIFGYDKKRCEDMLDEAFRTHEVKKVIDEIDKYLLPYYYASDFSKQINMIRDKINNEINDERYKNIAEEILCQVQEFNKKLAVINSAAKAQIDTEIQNIMKIEHASLREHIPSFQSFYGCQDSKLIEENLNLYRTLDNLINGFNGYESVIRTIVAPALEEKTAPSREIMRDEATDAEVLDTIISIFVSIRNNNYIMFHEYWSSVNYSEVDTNNFFGHISSSGYQLDKMYISTTFIAITTAVTKILQEINKVADVLFEKTALQTLTALSWERINSFKNNLIENSSQSNSEVAIGISLRENAVEYMTDPIAYVIRKFDNTFGLKINVMMEYINKMLKENDLLEIGHTLYYIKEKVSNLNTHTGYLSIAMHLPLIAFISVATYGEIKGNIEFGSNVANKLMTITNDKARYDKYHELRTIRLNVFDAGTLEFKMDSDKKALLIYEGYTKTMKFLAEQLHVQEMTNKFFNGNERTYFSFTVMPQSL